MAISPDQAMFLALDSGTSIMGLKIGRVRWNAESICLERGASPSPQKEPMSTRTMVFGGIMGSL